LRSSVRDRRPPSEAPHNYWPDRRSGISLQPSMIIRRCLKSAPAAARFPLVASDSSDAACSPELIQRARDMPLSFWRSGNGIFSRAGRIFTSVGIFGIHPLCGSGARPAFCLGPSSFAMPLEKLRNRNPKSVRQPHQRTNGGIPKAEFEVRQIRPMHSRPLAKLFLAPTVLVAERLDAVGQLPQSLVLLASKRQIGSSS